MATASSVWEPLPQRNMRDGRGFDEDAPIRRLLQTLLPQNEYVPDPPELECEKLRALFHDCFVTTPEDASDRSAFLREVRSACPWPTDNAEPAGANAALDCERRSYAVNTLSLALIALARLRELSVRDPLTGLYNRRGLEEEFQRCWQISRRNNRPIGVAMLDIDHFKAINDSHGHIVGDRILREFASLVRRTARRSDIVGRYGGDELVVILSPADVADCAAFGERLLEAVRRHEFCAECGLALKPTVSIGAACTVNAPADMTGECLIVQADAALYAAKKQGRNRISVYGPADIEKRSVL